MSDFFNDDFTAELKGYFIDSVVAELEKFIDLVDESTWKKVLIELTEQADAWSVDAKTNEFEFLSQALQDFSNKVENFIKPEDVIAALETLKAYLVELSVDKKDSAELQKKYSLDAKASGRSQFLLCHAGTVGFVIPVGFVKEVVDKIPVYALPAAKPGLSGVIPFRGEAVPVVNLQEYGFDFSSHERFYFVICELEGSRLALQVSDADQLLTLDNAELQPLSKDSFMTSVSFIKNFFIRDQKSVMVLDLEKLVA